MIWSIYTNFIAHTMQFSWTQCRRTYRELAEIEQIQEKPVQCR